MSRDTEHTFEDWYVDYKRCRGGDCSLAEPRMWHGYCDGCAYVEKARHAIAAMLRISSHTGAAELVETMTLERAYL